MSKQFKRSDACTKLIESIYMISSGPDITPPDLNRGFLEALTCFAATMSGHTSVIAGTDSDGEVEDFMFIFRN